MTQKRLEANRKNALKSTGPTTPRGKAVSSRNAVKHGLLATAPILPGIESGQAWEKHRDGIFESFAPVGYLEELLTFRLAVFSWRLLRVVRYEAKVSAAAVATAEADLEKRHGRRPPKTLELAKADEKIHNASLVIEVLEALPKLPDEESLETEAAVAAPWALGQEVPEDVEDISIPGIPDDDTAFRAFDHWTAGLLRKAAEVYAAAAQMTPEALLNKCIWDAHKNRYEAAKEKRDFPKRTRRWKLLLEFEKHSRMLFAPDVLDKVARYESNLERASLRTLHELQRLQAARSGAVVPPPATMDVDLTLHAERSS